MSEFNMLGWNIFFAMYAIGLPLVVVVIAEIMIHDEVKTRKQLKYFGELYGKCIQIHGLEFSQRLYDGCRYPWIGMEKMIAVFEHHCGLEGK